MLKKPVKVCCLRLTYRLLPHLLRVYQNIANEAANLDLGYRIVMTLMRYHLQSYHCLFMDNFFTSVHMAIDLLHFSVWDNACNEAGVPEDAVRCTSPEGRVSEVDKQ